MRVALVVVIALSACSHGSTPMPESHRPSDTGAVDETAFKALHEPPTDGKSVVLHGQTIALAGGKAYLSVPPGPGPFPGIVVIHEWWGLNENIEHWADRLASAGWAAVAIDLYAGKILKTPDDAMAAMNAVDETAASATIASAIDFLKTDPRVRATKRAVIGWCFGGGWSLQTALAHPELDGAIIYYGQLETDPGKLAAIKGKVLGVFGNLDQGIPPTSVDAFDAGLTHAKVPHEIFRYDAPHAFANPSNPKYVEPAAADAWIHVLAFLDKLKT